MTTTTEKNSDLDIDPNLFESPSLPTVQEDLKAPAELDEESRTRLKTLVDEIDVHDTHTIIFFGSKAQEQVTSVSDNMLDGVQNKDTGAAGDSLSEMVTTLRGFDAAGLEKPGFFARLFSKTKPVVKFLQRYEEVRKQIDVITDNLERHKTKLLTDVVSLDRLYGANLDYFHELELYIAAGDEKLRQLDEKLIPALEQEAQNTEHVIKAQELRDIRAARDELERRVHDLRLTRQVTLQSLPSIRVVQENDKGLITKINSTLVNTVPLWRQQLATGITVFRSSEAAKAVKGATDLTNELLEKNADMLKEASAESRRQIERGVFDIQAIHKANQSLIATIEEGLQIADEGKRLRAEAMVQLQECESELKNTLAAAKARVGD